MAIETAATIDTLNPSLPNATDPVSEGSGHLRLIKQALVNSFPNLKGVIAISTALLAAIQTAFSGRGSLDLAPPAGLGAVHGAQVYLQRGPGCVGDVVAQNIGDTFNVIFSVPEAGGVIAYPAQFVFDGNGAMNLIGAAPDLKLNGASFRSLIPPGVPQGVIMLWSGSATTVPAGWAICNGQNGLPDLRDRFIIGAGGSYSPYGAGYIIGTGGFTPSASTDAENPFLALCYIIKL